MTVLRQEKLKLSKQMLARKTTAKKKNSTFQSQKISLLISSLFMPKNLFYKSFFILQCILVNKINTIILVGTYATK